MTVQYPLEKLVEFSNDPYFLGRITVNKVKEVFYVEVDIVQKESFKIYKHISTLYNLESGEDALAIGYRELKLKIGAPE